MRKKKTIKKRTTGKIIGTREGGGNKALEKSTKLAKREWGFVGKETCEPKTGKEGGW